MQEFACAYVAAFPEINRHRRIGPFYPTWLNRSEYFPNKPFKIEKNYLSHSKGKIFSQLFCVAHS